MRLARAAAALWLAAIAAALTVGAFGSTRWQHAIADDGPACPWRLLTGVPCPFCGMTHAAVALGRGDGHAALLAHPLAPLVLALLIAVGVVVLIDRTDLITRGRRPYLWLGVVAAIWVVRLVRG